MIVLDHGFRSVLSEGWMGFRVEGAQGKADLLPHGLGACPDIDSVCAASDYEIHRLDITT